MGLQTDIIFVKALRADQSLLADLAAGDIYNTTIAMPDKELDNAELPLIIVSYDGMTNEPGTKDGMEGCSDTVNIAVMIAAPTREDLAGFTERVRTQIRSFFEDADPDDEDFELIPVDYSLSASRVMYDDEKPCYWQVLNYECDTNI